MHDTVQIEVQVVYSHEKNVVSKRWLRTGATAIACGVV